MATADLAALLAAEERRVTDGEAGCGHTCPCHTPLVCARTRHPDTPDNRVPHLARQDDGAVVQWVGGCCDPADATP